MKDFGTKTFKQAVDSMDGEILNSREFLFAIDTGEGMAINMNVTGGKMYFLISTLIKEVISRLPDDEQKKCFAEDIKHGVDLALEFQKVEKEDPVALAKRVLEVIERKKKSGTMNDKDREMEKMSLAVLYEATISPLQ